MWPYNVIWYYSTYYLTNLLLIKSNYVQFNYYHDTMDRQFYRSAKNVRTQTMFNPISIYIDPIIVNLTGRTFRVNSLNSSFLVKCEDVGIKRSDDIGNLRDLKMFRISDPSTGIIGIYHGDAYYIDSDSQKVLGYATAQVEKGSIIPIEKSNFFYILPNYSPSQLETLQADSSVVNITLLYLYEVRWSAMEGRITTPLLAKISFFKDDLKNLREWKFVHAYKQESNLKTEASEVYVIGKRSRVDPSQGNRTIKELFVFGTCKVIPISYTEATIALPETEDVVNAATFFLSISQADDPYYLSIMFTAGTSTKVRLYNVAEVTRAVVLARQACVKDSHAKPLITLIKGSGDACTSSGSNLCINSVPFPELAVSAVADSLETPREEFAYENKIGFFHYVNFAQDPINVVLYSILFTDQTIEICKIPNLARVNCSSPTEKTEYMLDSFPMVDIRRAVIVFTPTRLDTSIKFIRLIDCSVFTSCVMCENIGLLSSCNYVESGRCEPGSRETAKSGICFSIVSFEPNATAGGDGGVSTINVTLSGIENLNIFDSIIVRVGPMGCRVFSTLDKVITCNLDAYVEGSWPITVSLIRFWGDPAYAESAGKFFVAESSDVSRALILKKEFLIGGILATCVLVALIIIVRGRCSDEESSNLKFISTGSVLGRSPRSDIDSKVSMPQMPILPPPSLPSRNRRRSGRTPPKKVPNGELVDNEDINDIIVKAALLRASSRSGSKHRSRSRSNSRSRSV